MVSNIVSHIMSVFIFTLVIISNIWVGFSVLCLEIDHRYLPVTTNGFFHWLGFRSLEPGAVGMSSHFVFRAHLNLVAFYSRLICSIVQTWWKTRASCLRNLQKYLFKGISWGISYFLCYLLARNLILKVMSHLLLMQ